MKHSMARHGMGNERADAKGSQMHQQAQRHGLKVDAKHEPIKGGVVNDSHQEGIHRVVQRAGDHQMGQGGKLGTKHKHHC